MSNPFFVVPPPQLLRLHREREIAVAVFVDAAIGLQEVPLVHVDYDLAAVAEMHPWFYREDQAAVLVPRRGLALAVTAEKLGVWKELQAAGLNERVGLHFVKLFFFFLTKSTE